MVLQWHWDPFERPSRRGVLWFQRTSVYDIVRHEAEEFKNVANRQCQKINAMSRSDLFKYVRDVITDNWRSNGEFVAVGSLQRLERVFYSVGWHDRTIMCRRFKSKIHVVSNLASKWFIIWTSYIGLSKLMHNIKNPYIGVSRHPTV